MRTKLPDRSDCSWLPPSCGFTHMTLIVRFMVYMFYVLCFISPKPIPQENIFVDQHQVLFVHRDHNFNGTPVVIWKQYSWIYQGLNACLALAGKGSEDPEISKAPVILCEPPSTCLDTCFCRLLSTVPVFSRCEANKAVQWRPEIAHLLMQFPSRSMGVNGDSYPEWEGDKKKRVIILWWWSLFLEGLA